MNNGTHKEWIKIGVVMSVILVCIGLAYYFRLGEYVTLHSLKVESERLKEFVTIHYHSSVLIFMLGFVFFLVAGIPSTIPLVLLSGYLFGAFWGALYSALAATIGSACSFLLFRYCIKGVIKRRYEHRLAYFKRQMDSYGDRYLLVLHYSSIVPFFFINMLAALSTISLARMVVISFIGALPVYLVFASAGRNLSTINSARDIFSLPVIGMICLLVVMALLPVIIRKVKGIHRVDDEYQNR